MANDYNVIIILGDALRKSLMNCYGYTGNKTSPTMDSLAERGVLFENVVACSNHTDPSITSIMSGQYPMSHGIMHHGRRVDENELDALKHSGARFLSEFLKDNGYSTIGFDWLGRWHKRGFDYFGEEGPYPAREARIEQNIDMLNETDATKKRLKQLCHRVGIHLPGRSGVYYTRQAIRYIEKNHDKKFFIFIHNWDTHTPFDIIPDDYRSMFYKDNGSKKVMDMLPRIKNRTWRRIVRDYHLDGVKYIEEILPMYEAGVRLFDDSIRDLVKVLHDKDIMKKTIIIVTGDHGDNPLRDDVFVGHFGLYDPVIRVPLIMCGPGVPASTKIGSTIQHTEIVPTLLDILGIDYGDHNFDGKSLLPMFENDNHSIRDFTITTDGASTLRYALRTRRHKYIHAPPGSKRLIPFDTIWNGYKDELYDLDNDPDERNNIMDSEPGLANKMKDKLYKAISNYAEQGNNTAMNDSKENYSKDDEKKIKERLQALGYLD